MFAGVALAGFGGNQATVPAASNPAPPRGGIGKLTTVRKLDGPNAKGNKSVTLHCPAGLEAISGGADIVGASGVALSTNAPTKKGDGWGATAFATKPGQGNWALLVTAICARPARGQQPPPPAPPGGR